MGSPYKLSREKIEFYSNGIRRIYLKCHENVVGFALPRIGNFVTAKKKFKLFYNIPLTTKILYFFLKFGVTFTSDWKKIPSLQESDVILMQRMFRLSRSYVARIIFNEKVSRNVESRLILTPRADFYLGSC